MASYPKTTGSKGIHIYVRVEPGWDSFAIRGAVVALAREMAARGHHLALTARRIDKLEALRAQIKQDHHRLPVAEYAPREIKQSVVGKGGADKQQVQHMVRVLLNLSDTPQADAADALAAAERQATRAVSSTSLDG
mgnify:CR=1 FL=1